MNDLHKVKWSAPKGARFFEWKGPAAGVDEAIAWATQDMLAAWEAVCAASRDPGAKPPSYVEGKAPAAKVTLRNPQSFIMNYAPIWTIGSAMLVEMSTRTSKDAPRGIDVMLAHEALARHEASRHRACGQRGRLDLYAEINGAGAKTQNEVAYGVNYRTGDGTGLLPHGTVRRCPVVARAAMAPLVMKVVAKGRTAAGIYNQSCEAERSSTMAAARATTDGVASNRGLIAWYRQIGLERTARELESLPGPWDGK